MVESSDWLEEVEKYFTLMNIPAERQVPYVSYKLRGGASAWWKQLRTQNIRNNRPMITE